MSAPLVVTAARMVDGHTVRENPMLVIRDGRISHVGSRADPVPAGATPLEFGDVTLIPGMIDVHAHLALGGELDGQDALEHATDEEVVAHMLGAADVALAGGVTTLRDLGAPRLLGPHVRDLLAAADRPTPRVLTAGPPLTVAGGHAHFLGAVVAGERQIRATVRDLRAAGVDLIKVMSSGGRLTPGSNTSQTQFTDAELTAMVEEAHANGLPVTAHAYPPAAIEQAVRCGVDGIEHCFFSVDGGLAPDPELIDRIAEAGTAVCPTLGLTPEWPVPPGFRAFLDVFEQVFAEMHRRGVRLVAGVDSGALPGKPHDAQPYAIAEFARLGMSNAEALEAGTSAAARVCGLGERTGALRPGFDADIVAVHGNPLTRAADVARVCAVLVAGVLVRDDLGAARDTRHAPA